VEVLRHLCGDAGLARELVVRRTWVRLAGEIAAPERD
jgi:hypothetical protein